MKSWNSYLFVLHLKQVKQVNDSTESTYNEVNMRLKDKINKKKESKDSPIEKSETLRALCCNNKIFESKSYLVFEYNMETTLKSYHNILSFLEKLE